MSGLCGTFGKVYNFIRLLAKKQNRKYAAIAVIFVVGAGSVLCAFDVGGHGESKVYAVQSNSGSGEARQIQAGLMGLVSCVNSMEAYSASAEEIVLENENEDILVGTTKVKRHAVNRISVEKGAQAIGNVGYFAQQTVNNHQMADEDYFSLLQIVEAEATGGDMKSKILIANVVLNRVKDANFPSKIYDVIWQRVGGSAQFSPTADGRIYTVPITEETIQAVDAALSGVDYSQGALFFVARKSAAEHNVEWFDGNLEPLFEHGGHEFFKFAEAEE